MSLKPPLTGIRLLDLSRVLAGPVCSQVLGDLGATVIKVERPGRGDDTRHWGPPFVDGQSAYFQSVNRNKKSVTLDLRNSAGRTVLDDLVRRSDLLLENFLPDDVEKFGLSPERLARLNPDLVSCSISGFGRTGPWKDRPGYDVVVQALSGLMAITGPVDSEPSKVGVAITDVVTGLYAAISLLSGLWARNAPAQGDQSSPRLGCAFDLALLDCTLSSLVNVMQSHLVTGEEPVRYGNAHPTIVPYQTFAVADGHLMLACGNDGQFAKLCECLGRPDWASDARFADNPSRVQHRAEFIPALTELFSQKSLAEWCELLTQAEVPHAPVQTLGTACALEQVAARELIVQTQDATGNSRLLRSPIKIDGRSLPAPTAPPDLGVDTEPVLQDVLDYSREQIADLRSRGAFG